MRRQIMQIVLILVGGWIAIVLTLFLLQRKMVFPAPPPLSVPTGANASLIQFGPDGAKGVALWVAPRDGGPVVVHFHGNAEQLAGQAELAGLYGRRGLGFLAIEYPGYGPLAGMDASEQAIIEHAVAGLRHLRDDLGIPVERTVLQGRSLGSGVACAMAAQGYGSRMVLLSPFTSLVDVASDHYRWVPVGLLMRDRFNNMERAKRIEIPALIIHGDRDEIVPYDHGQSLSKALKNVEFMTIAGAGHNDLLARGGQAVLSKMLAFALEASVLSQRTHEDL